MTIRELYERALAEGKADMTVVFPNRDYEYGYQPYILATGIEDPIKNKYNDGLIVITGTQEIGQEDTEDMEEESEDNYAQYDEDEYASEIIAQLADKVWCAYEEDNSCYPYERFIIAKSDLEDHFLGFANAISSQTRSTPEQCADDIWYVLNNFYSETYAIVCNIEFDGIMCPYLNIGILKSESEE